jgi:hypothetical protein
MEKPWKQGAEYHKGISMHKIPVEGAVGLLFAFATVFIFVVGIPAVRGLLVITGISGMLGPGILCLWRTHHHKKIHFLHLDSSADSIRPEQIRTDRD